MSAEEKKDTCDLRSPLDSIRDAVLTVSPNRQYLGILRPTIPAQTGPTANVSHPLYKYTIKVLHSLRAVRVRSTVRVKVK